MKLKSPRIRTLSWGTPLEEQAISHVSMSWSFFQFYPIIWRFFVHFSMWELNNLSLINCEIRIRIPKENFWCQEINNMFPEILFYLDFERIKYEMLFYPNEIFFLLWLILRNFLCLSFHLKLCWKLLYRKKWPFFLESLSFC